MKITEKSSQDFIKEVTPKTTIVLHYTAGGTMAGGEAQLAIRDYVNVHYGIDDNGNIYRYFPEKYWAYHTGTNKKDNQCSIGVEVRCWGQLTRKNNQLFSWTGKVIPWGKVVKCAPFRGFEYWEMLTEAELAAVRWLISDIKTRNPIKKVITHAMIKATKLDYPPDYPGIKELLVEVNK